jgi:hypothetical protein
MFKKKAAEENNTSPKCSIMRALYAIKLVLPNENHRDNNEERTRCY